MDHEIWLLPLPYTDVYAWIGTAISALASLAGIIASKKIADKQSSSSSSSSDLSGAISSGISAVGNVAASEIAAKKQFEKQNYFMDKANNYNRTAIHRAVEDARSAGFNPASALGLGSDYQSVTPSAPLPSTPDLSAIANMGFKTQEMQIQSDLAKSQESVNSANANYLNTLARGKELSNTFLGDTIELKTKLTNAEYQNALYLQGYYASNPDLLNAVAEKQKVLNENLSSSTDVNKKNLDVMRSIIDKNSSDISLNDKKIASMYIQDNFTRAQIQEISDRNLRENYTNVGYLVDRMKALSSSSLPDDQKSEKLALLRDLYDNASGYSRMKLQYQYDKNLQDAKIAAQSEQVDKYIDLQHDRLDWEKTQFGVNKVFEVVDKVGDAILPFYEQKHSDDFRREMQQNEFEHEEKMQKNHFDNQKVDRMNQNFHDFEKQRRDQSFKSSESEKQRKWQSEEKATDRYYDEKHRLDDFHKYEDTESWYDENGVYHSHKHKH